MLEISDCHKLILSLRTVTFYIHEDFGLTSVYTKSKDCRISYPGDFRLSSVYNKDYQFSYFGDFRLCHQFMLSTVKFHRLVNSNSGICQILYIRYFRHTHQFKLRIVNLFLLGLSDFQHFILRTVRIHIVRI